MWSAKHRAWHSKVPSSSHSPTTGTAFKMLEWHNAHPIQQSFTITKMKKLILAKNWLYASYYMCIIFLNPCNSPVWYVLLSPVNRWGNWGSRDKRWSRVTWQGSDKARIFIQIGVTLEPSGHPSSCHWHCHCSYPLPHHLFHSQSHLLAYPARDLSGDSITVEVALCPFLALSDSPATVILFKQILGHSC